MLSQQMPSVSVKPVRSSSCLLVQSKEPFSADAGGEFIQV